MSDLVVSDLGEHPCEPGLRIDVVELGGLNQGEGDSYGFAPALWTCEHPVFPTDGDGFDGALGCVVAQF